MPKKKAVDAVPKPESFPFPKGNPGASCVTSAPIKTTPPRKTDYSPSFAVIVLKQSGAKTVRHRINIQVVSDTPYQPIAHQWVRVAVVDGIPFGVDPLHIDMSLRSLHLFAYGAKALQAQSLREVEEYEKTPPQAWDTLSLVGVKALFLLGYLTQAEHQFHVEAAYAQRKLFDASTDKKEKARRQKEDLTSLSKSISSLTTQYGKQAVLKVLGSVTPKLSIHPVTKKPVKSAGVLVKNNESNDTW